MKTQFFQIAVVFAALTACGTAPQPVAETKPETPAGAAARLTPARPELRDLEIAAGVRLAVRMNSTISTKTNKAGETFSAELTQPLTVDGAVIAPKGALVTGVVANSNPGGRIKGRAQLALRLTSIHSPSGPLPIATSLVYREANGSKKRDAIAIGASSGAGAGIGAAAGGGSGAAIGAGIGAGAGTAGVLLTRGAPAVIPAESVLTFTLRDRVRISRT